MATLKQQIAKAKDDVKRFEALLASADDYAAANNLTTKTQAQTEYGKALEEAKSKVTKLEGEIKKKKAEKNIQEKVASGDYTPDLPFPVDDKIINELKNAGIPINPQSFQVGGVGAGVFVYQGETVSKSSVRGKPIEVKTPKVEVVSNVVNSFWEDQTIQNKVMSALVASGNSNATQLDAFATWDAAVKKSAELYNGGRGPKFTPIDILNMSITKSGGPRVTTYLDVPRDSELKQILKKRVFDFIKKEPTDNDPMFVALFNDIKALYEKGQTTTTTTDASGREVVKRSPGVTDATIQAKIEKLYNQNNQDFLENKSLEGADLFSQWQRG